MTSIWRCPCCFERFEHGVRCALGFVCVECAEVYLDALKEAAACGSFDLRACPSCGRFAGAGMRFRAEGRAWCCSCALAAGVAGGACPGRGASAPSPSSGPVNPGRHSPSPGAWAALPVAPAARR
jgi:hypothetical protein